MPNDPRPELFEDVAGQFERLEQPLNMAWMCDRGVSLEETQALSQQIAVIIRGYLALPPRDRIAFVTQGVFNRPESPAEPAKTVLGRRSAQVDKKPAG